MEMSLTIRR